MTDDELEELARPEYGSGRCRDEALKLAREDRSLTIVRGWAIPVGHAMVQHWWLIDCDGNIVDPTVDQFPLKPLYSPECVGVPVERPQRVHLCPNCGGEHFGEYDYTVCSERCARSYAAYLGVPWGTWIGGAS